MVVVCVATVTGSPIHNATAIAAHHQRLLHLQQQLAKQKHFSAFKPPQLQVPSFESWSQPVAVNKPPPRQPDRTWNPKCRPYYQLECEGPCFDGNVLDGDGCQTCTCCKALNCDSYCEASEREINDQGCKTCRCKTASSKFHESRWYQEHKEYNHNSLDSQYGHGSSSRSHSSRGGGGGGRLSAAHHLICPAKKYCPITCVQNVDRNGCEVCDCRYKSVKQKQKDDRMSSKWRRPGPKISSKFFGKK